MTGPDFFETARAASGQERRLRQLESREIGERLRAAPNDTSIAPTSDSPCPRHEGPRSYCGCGLPLPGVEPCIDWAAVVGWRRGLELRVFFFPSWDGLQ